MLKFIDIFGAEDKKKYYNFINENFKQGKAED
jgi:hypothetical protein